MPIIPLQSAPGIQRDGTVLASKAYTDGLWCRFQRGLPRKMGGYKVIQPFLTGIGRAINSQAQTGYRYIDVGNQTGIDEFTMDQFGVTSAVQNPNFPATTNPTTAGVSQSPLNSWQFETQFDNASGNMLLFAFCGQNILDPTNAANFPLYARNVYTQGAPFVQVAGFGTGSDGHGGTQQALFPNGISGGIVSLAPYMIVYGNNGFFAWSAPGDPTDFTGISQGSLFVGATEITNQKIIKGIPLRGGGGFSPAGLFWSIDSVIRATFIGITNGTWQFDQLTTQSSILSDRCVIENDGTFYWAGTDRFLMYNGVIQEIPNSMNLNWFYDNINIANAGKSFAFKIPRWGEIWWCYPRGANTECSHAVIYNYREKYWYDTPLPTFLRSAGLHGDNLVGNIMCDTTGYQSQITGGNKTYYNMWQHENGVDSVNGTSLNAVQSFYTTAPITGLTIQQPVDTAMAMEMLQPDFIQTGDMQVTVLKQNNARAPVVTGSQVTIQATPASPLNQIVPLKDTAKILRVNIQSNTIGGSFQAGASVIDVNSDDGRDT
jgi:hypothetical protein